jgi:hypothetical protein
MRIIQTDLSETEHALLTRYARDNGKTIQEVVRELVRDLALPDRVRAGDPVFSEPTVGRKRGTKETMSTNHDKVLYEGK